MWNKAIVHCISDLLVFVLSSGLLTVVWNRLAWDNNFASITFWFAMLMVFTITVIIRYSTHKWED